ncbi:hypothetical protein J7K70_01870 [bacterium]|nr:hypothetical protein [bacterium]
MKLKSRKFWLTVAGVLFGVTGWIIGNLEPLQAMQIIAKTIGVYLGVEGLIDFAKALKGAS